MIGLKNQKIRKLGLDALKEIGKKEGKAEEKIAVLNKLADDEKVEYTREELSEILGIADEKKQEKKQPPIPIEEIQKKFDEQFPGKMKGKPLKQYTGERKVPSQFEKLKEEGKEDGRIEEKIAIINRLIDDPKIKYSPEELSEKIWDDE